MKVIDLDQLHSESRMNFPIVIPVFNTPTYLRNTVSFFSSRGFSEFLILDNGSTYSGMQEAFDELPEDSMVLSLPHNPGPRVFYDNKHIYGWLPETFIATDPDLGFQEVLDKESIMHLVEVSDRIRMFKVGAALDIEFDAPSVIDLPFNYNNRLISIREIESMYYNQLVSATDYGDLIYSAAIDTTFSVYNKKYDNGMFMDNNVRVAGRYSVIHYGWYLNPPIPDEEYEYYKEAVKGKQYASTETLKRGEKYDY